MQPCEYLIDWAECAFRGTQPKNHPWIWLRCTCLRARMGRNLRAHFELISYTLTYDLTYNATQFVPLRFSTSIGQEKQISSKSGNNNRIRPVSCSADFSWSGTWPGNNRTRCIHLLRVFAQLDAERQLHATIHPSRDIHPTTTGWKFTCPCPGCTQTPDSSWMYPLPCLGRKRELRPRRIFDLEANEGHYLSDTSVT